MLHIYNCDLQDLDSMVRYVSPVNPAVYPHLAITLLSIGLFFMAWFFVYPSYIMGCPPIISGAN